MVPPMATLRVFPEPQLLQRCVNFPVEQLDPSHAASEDWARVFQNALADCARYHGLAIAAPQLGHVTRWFAVPADGSLGMVRPEVFVNPVLVDQSDDVVTCVEGCLSLPGVRLAVTRARRVRARWVSGLDRTSREAEFEGLMARVFLHEFDHLDGVLSLDRTSNAERKRVEPAIQAMRQGV